MVNAVRGMVKSAGHRLPKCSTESFAKMVRSAIPPGYELALMPLIEQVAAVTEQIRQMDKQIEALAKRYPEVERLRSVPGVGPVIGAAYVLTLDSPATVVSSRAVGAFPGVASAAIAIGGFRPAASHQQNRQRVSAAAVGAGGAVCAGAVRAGFGATALGVEAGGQWRQARQKARRGGGGPQTRGLCCTACGAVGNDYRAVSRC